MNNPCRGCVRYSVFNYKCVLDKKSQTNMQKGCPCLKCLVKVTCTDSCFDFKKHLLTQYGIKHSDEKLREYHGPPNKKRYGL